MPDPKTLYGLGMTTARQPEMAAHIRPDAKTQNRFGVALINRFSRLC